MNEGKRLRTGSLSLQAKSGASTARAASRRRSSRHIWISYTEFIELIHVFNSYTKFIVLIYFINSLQDASTCLSRSTRITRGKGSLGGMQTALSVWNECNILSINMNYTYDFSIFMHCMKKYVHELITWWNSNMK